MAGIDYGIKWDDIAKANATIKTTAIHNKDYAEVNQRVKAFRTVYPTGFIITHMTLNEGLCIFRAEVGFYSDAGPVVLASGTAYEKENSSQINRTSFIENCETSAVGRAIGMAGYGIETSICSAEELNNAMYQQANPPAPPAKPTRAKAKAQPQPAPVEQVEPIADTPEEAEYRAKVLQAYDAEMLDSRCMSVFGTPFAGTPVAVLKTMLPADKVEERIASKGGQTNE